MRRLSVLVAAALTAVFYGAGAALAQSTAFTYQGDLKSGGTPATGLHDMRFRLFPAATGGTAIGSQLCVDNVAVTEGRFTVSLDFGQQFASTLARFLEIEVRTDTGLSCASASGFALLSPRQPITVAPRAMAASVANALAAPDGSPASAVFVDNAGKVGVGTSAPTHSLHIATIVPTLALQDTNPASQQAGYISYRDDANVERAWIGYGTAGSPHFSIVNARPGGDIEFHTFTNGNLRFSTNVQAMTITPAGNVGIGTASPTAKLDVRGNIALGSSAEHRAVGSLESLRIVRGSVNPGGCTSTPVITSGNNFSVTSLSCEELRIDFTPPFTGTPVVVGSSELDVDGGGRFVTCSNVSSSSVAIRVFAPNGNNDRHPFSFIAVGPR